MMDIDNKTWTPKAKLSWEEAKEVANKKNHDFVNQYHLFLALWKNANPSFIDFLKSRGINLSFKKVFELLSDFEEKFPAKFFGKEDVEATKASFSAHINLASKLASKLDNCFIGVEHFIYAALETEEDLQKFLEEKTIDVDHLKLAIKSFISGDFEEEDAELEIFGGVDDDEEIDLSRKNLLEKFCVCLNEEVLKPSFQKISGRDKEISLLEEILCRKTKGNAILVADAGTGKTAIVEGLAQAIQKEGYSGPLKDKKIFSLDVSLLVAGTKYRGQFEERLSVLLKEFKNPNYILFVDEIHNIVGSGSKEGSGDMANIIKPALARGEIKCIGATTVNEYKKYFEKDAALSRRFYPIYAAEPSAQDVISIVENSLSIYETHHNVKFPLELAKEAVLLAEKYLPHQRFPDKAFDVIDQSCSKARIRSSEKDIVVCEEDVYAVVADKVNINPETIKKDFGKEFSTFAEDLKKEIFGQDEKIEAIYDILACAKAGLKEPNKPIASLLFVGPTSVGKTYTAKKIAKRFYGNDQSFLRLDMSEYQEAHAISKLIGTSAGYVGYEDGGLLTDFVRKNPNSLILFDEIEKSHKSILNILLQIMDEGKLKDNLNREVDFSRCIIIFTSNLSAEVKGRSMGFIQDSQNEVSEQFSQSVKKYLSPELQARIDEIIVFNNLNSESLDKIFEASLKEMSDGLKKTGKEVVFDLKRKDLLDVGDLNPDHARDLKQILRKSIGTRIAKFIINNPQKSQISVKVLDKTLYIC